MSEPGEGDVALACVAALLDELVRGGVAHVCMTPGSRSTPIALAAARHPGIRLHRARRRALLGVLRPRHRGRLGCASCAMFCTSGTAAANHFPAVIEASMSRIPIIVLTADRPPELHGVGANQTIDQQHLFGGFVRWFFDTGVPVAGPAARVHWASAGARAIARALGTPRGPVHLNLPFREPLLQAGAAADGAAPARPDPGLDPTVPPRADHAAAFAREVRTGHRIAVVAGRLRHSPAGLVDLCAERGWPLLAEPVSGVRVGRIVRSHRTPRGRRAARGRRRVPRVRPGRISSSRSEPPRRPAASRSSSARGPAADRRPGRTSSPIRTVARR